METVDEPPITGADDHEGREGGDKDHEADDRGTGHSTGGGGDGIHSLFYRQEANELRAESGSDEGRRTPAETGGGAVARAPSCRSGSAWC